jgi:hypothetical protein
MECFFKEVNSMKFATFILTIASLFGIVFVPNVRASEFDKKTLVTFNQPMEVLGIVLPAGEYVIKRADRSLPDVVRFTNAEENHVYATAFAIPIYRSKPASEVVIVTEERRSGEPEAIKEWFYPGDIVGAEFVYPKSSGTLIAMAIAPSTTAESASRPFDLTTAPAPPSQPLMTQNEEPAYGEAQPQQPVEIAQAPAPSEPVPVRAQSQPSQSEPEQEETMGQEELPKTASSLPVAGFWGALAIMGGAILRRFSRQRG